MHTYIYIRKYEDIKGYFPVKWGGDFATSKSIDKTEDTVLRETKTHRKTSAAKQANSVKESRWQLSKKKCRREIERC